MYKDKRVLAVIPARGGSKGVPKKNLRTINGIPLVAVACICAKNVDMIDVIVVSTDCNEIAEAAQKYGAKAPFKRPKLISGDDASDLDVLDHALDEMEKQTKSTFDVVVMLQPTSPLRTPLQVSSVISKLIDEELDAVWTVSPTGSKYHPTKQLRITNGLLEYCLPEGKKIPPRQHLEQVYHVNGIAYALTRSCIVDQKHRLGKCTGASIIDGPAISIDTVDDFELVENILNNHMHNKN